MNRKLGAGLACAGLLVFSTQALAWGDRERAALWGVVGGAILANSWNSAPSQPGYRQEARVVYAPPRHVRVQEYRTVYAPPPRHIAQDNPYYGNRGAAEAFERGRATRQREQQVQLERDAFEQGYSGAWGDWR
jgi:hypothetical protein